MLTLHTHVAHKRERERGGGGRKGDPCSIYIYLRDFPLLCWNWSTPTLWYVYIHYGSNDHHPSLSVSPLLLLSHPGITRHLQSAHPSVPPCMRSFARKRKRRRGALFNYAERPRRDEDEKGISTRKRALSDLSLSVHLSVSLRLSWSFDLARYACCKRWEWKKSLLQVVDSAPFIILDATSLFSRSQRIACVRDCLAVKKLLKCGPPIKYANCITVLSI